MHLFITKSAKDTFYHLFGGTVVHSLKNLLINLTKNLYCCTKVVSMFGFALRSSQAVQFSSPFHCTPVQSIRSTCPPQCTTVHRQQHQGKQQACGLSYTCANTAKIALVTSKFIIHHSLKCF